MTPCDCQEVADQARVAGRDAHAVELGELGEPAGGGGEPERRLTEIETRDLDRGRPGVEQQVAARDADVERAGAHIGRDVARAKVEELDIVARVGDGQCARVAAAGVSGLQQHLGRRLAQRTLVGYCDSQHF